MDIKREICLDQSSAQLTIILVDSSPSWVGSILKGATILFKLIWEHLFLHQGKEPQFANHIRSTSTNERKEKWIWESSAVQLTSSYSLVSSSKWAVVDKNSSGVSGSTHPALHFEVDTANKRKERKDDFCILNGCLFTWRYQKYYFVFSMCTCRLTNVWMPICWRPVLRYAVAFRWGTESYYYYVAVEFWLGRRRPHRSNVIAYKIS